MFFYTILLITILLFGCVTSQSFSLYPTIDNVKLAAAFKISTECLDALNTTLPCDAALFQMTASVDNYFWETDNVTNLCTRDCYSAVQNWNKEVEIACYYDTLVAHNKEIPASSIADRFRSGMNIACLTNQNSTTEDDLKYCLIESQEWTGSDVVRPDCTAQSSDPACVDPTAVSPDNERMANLYGNDVLCSECFVQLMYNRLSSPYLPDHDHSDYLIDQYFDILDVCNATNNMPELIVRPLPEYTTAVPAPLNFTISPPKDISCTGGQFIVSSTLDPNVNCASLSQAFHVATGTVQVATNSTECKATANFCLPAPCTLHQVSIGESCEDLATSFSTAKLKVSTMQILSWNPNIRGLCDSLQAGDSVCSSPPGGSYVPPSPQPGSVTDGSQARGGGDGNHKGGLLCTQQQKPSLVQKGISSACTKWCQAYARDYCYNFAQETSITTDRLYTLNPVLGAGGSKCDTQFQTGYWYCVSSS